MKKVIYFFTRRHVYNYDNEMFQANVFLENDISVEFWSSVRWTFPGIKDPLAIRKDKTTHYIDNNGILVEELKRLNEEKSDCVFLMYPYHDYCFNTYEIRKAIKKFGYKFSNIVETPTMTEVKKGYSKLRQNMIYCLWAELLLIAKTVLRYVRGIFVKKRNSESGVKDAVVSLYGPFTVPSQFNFVTVRAQYRTFPNMLETISKKNIIIHSDSYDEYLVSQKAESSIPYRYVVHIDGYEIGHSDFVKQGIPFPIMDREKFFGQMNKLFDRIESELGYRVVIAAHPKAEYSGNEFGNREIVYGKTKVLIRDAEFVTLGLSTCMNLVLLNKKPFITIYSDEYFRNIPEWKERFALLESKLNCKNLNVNDDYQISNFQEKVTYYNKKMDKIVTDVIKNEDGIEDKLFYRVVLEHVFSQ